MTDRAEKLLALKQKARDKAKAAKKAWLERPEVKDRLEKLKADRREKAKVLRKKMADARKASKSTEKKNLRQSQADTRKARQEKRDEELRQMIMPGSEIAASNDTPLPSRESPRLRVINGGKSN
jgi:hypothetical protein